ncbi:MAG: copper resistance protein NlpE N-terminal domain-containing protein [Ostreibacterium sp.]
MKKTIAFIFALSLFLNGCVSQNNRLQLVGTYYANLPCDNCRGYAVDMNLDKDNTYITIIYPSDTQKETVEEGTWAITGNRLTLTPKKGTIQNQQTRHLLPVIHEFKIIDTTLTLLTKEQESYKKEAKRYIFTKK